MVTQNQIDINITNRIRKLYRAATIYQGESVVKDFNDYVKQISDIDKEISVTEDMLRDMKSEKGRLREAVIELLKDSGFDSIKGQTATASITRKTTIKPVDEAKVMHWLTANDFDANAYTKLDAKLVTPVLMEAYTQQGEIPEGTELTETESLRLTPRKDK